MGDRGNVFVIQHPPGKPSEGIYIYTHWEGFGLPKRLQIALNRGRERWDDEPYLTRIIASTVCGNSWSALDGFGLSTYLTDNEYPIAVVDVNRQTIGFAREGEEPKTYKKWSFSEYVALSEDDLEKARE